MALVLLGVAALQRQVPWLAAMLIVFGLLGFGLEMIGIGIPAITYIGTAAIGIWVLAPATSSIEQSRS